MQIKIFEHEPKYRSRKKNQHHKIEHRKKQNTREFKVELTEQKHIIRKKGTQGNIKSIKF